LSLPKRLRYYLQRDREALNGALRILLAEIARYPGAHSPGARPDARAGAVAFIHRFGSSLNLHTHFHGCVSDGVFEPDAQGGIRFYAVDELDRHRLIYHRQKPGPDGRTQLILSPLELIERIAALVPPPRMHVGA
jgi:hypothetical protein